MKKILMWLIIGTRGGINRGKIIKKLNETPSNANKISNSLNLNYRTVTHHLKILEKNNIVTTIGDRYGKVYILSEDMEKEFSDFDEIWEQIEDTN